MGIPIRFHRYYKKIKYKNFLKKEIITQRKIQWQLTHTMKTNSQLKKKIISEIKLLLDIFKFNDDNLKFWKDDWEVCHSSVIKQFPMEET